MRVALVSREIYPLHGGGIGQFVRSAAVLLSRIAEVTVFTTSVLEPTYRRLSEERDPRLPPEAVRIEFVPEPSIEEAEAWNHVMHCYSARVLERLKEVYADAPPDLIEFPDYLGEAFVPLQAAAALDRFLRETRICVRMHTTAEIVELLDGFCKPDFPSRVVHDLERYSLAHADAVIWQGGDILGTYERYYGEDALGPAVRIRYPFSGAIGAAEPEFDLGGRPLRLLFMGRLERRKGVVDLVRAVTGIERDDVSVSLVGGDTGTGPMGTSVRGLVELAAGEDERVQILGEVERGGLGELIRTHDVAVVPSLWECWPYAALEPLHLNRPVLGTPVGGLVEMVQPGRSGWLAPGTGALAIEEALGALLDQRDAIRELVASGGPVALARELSDEREILDGYESLARQPLRRPVPSRPAAHAVPLVSAIIPYFRAERFVRDTVASLVAQTYPRLEIVLVNDGSFDDEDWVVAELASRMPVVVVTQLNQGLGAARNFGIGQSRGRYVFPLDADNVAEPDFVARCVDVLEARPDVAYVTTWSRYIDEDGVPRQGPNLGYEPLGNQSRLIVEDNVAGDAAAVIPRRIFDSGFRYSEELTSFEDWAFYRRLRDAGHFGAVIPQRLLRYRVREDSMQARIAQPYRARLVGEINAHIEENRIRWTS